MTSEIEVTYGFGSPAPKHNGWHLVGTSLKSSRQPLLSTKTIGLLVEGRTTKTIGLLVEGRTSVAPKERKTISEQNLASFPSNARCYSM